MTATEQLELRIHTVEPYSMLGLPGPPIPGVTP
jgi:hypothetical protein